MVTSNDIHLQFLIHLERPPTDVEIALFTVDDVIQDVTNYIFSIKEYKLKNNIFECNKHFSTDTNVFTVSNIVGDYGSGCTLTNGYMFLETSSIYNKAKSCFIKKNDNTAFDIFDFTNFNFRSAFLDNITDHNQSLDMNHCKFVDNFNLNSHINVNIEKIPLHVYPDCFLQKITMLSDTDTELNLIQKFKHETNMKYHSCSKFYMKEYYKHFFHLENDKINMNLMYSHSPHVTSKGCLLHNSLINVIFTISLIAQSPFEFHIICTCQEKTNETVAYDNISLKIQAHSYSELIETNKLYWSNKWNTRIHIVNKNIADITDYNVNFHIVKALFDIYSDVTYSKDMLLHHLPTLILLKPELAKKNLNHIIDNKIHQTDFTMVYEKALIIIHIWNYFRTSRDTSWLKRKGFLVMCETMEYIMTYIDKTTFTVHNIISMNKMNAQNNNAMTNHLVSLAIRFVNQAVYALDEIFVKKYRDVLNKINIKYYTESHTTQVTDTHINVLLGSNNGIYHYDFYENTNNKYLGYAFGGTDGNLLSLQPNTVYTFTLDYPLDSYPILFGATSDSTIVHHIDYQTVNGNNVVQHSYEINSTNIIGYSHSNTNDISDTFALQFNHIYGENAFVTSNTRNMIKPYDNYAYETLDYVEPYLLFNSYYNELFDVPKDTLTDMIDDNINFFINHSSNTEFNVIHEAGLHALVAQYKDTYQSKRTKINMFYNKISKVINSNNDPWGNQNGKMILFTVLTCLFELTPTGVINHSKFLIEDYGLKYTTRNVLPDKWKQMYISNIDNNDTYTITNSLYTNDDFMSLDTDVTITTDYRDITYYYKADGVTVWKHIKKTTNYHDLYYFNNYNETGNERWHVMNVEYNKYDYIITKYNSSDWDFYYHYHNSIFDESGNNPATYTVKYRDEHYVQNFFVLNGVNDIRADRLGNLFTRQLNYYSSSFSNIIKVKSTSWFIYCRFNKPLSGTHRLFYLEYTKKWRNGKNVWLNISSNGTVELNINLTYEGGSLKLTKQYSLKNTNNDFLLIYNHTNEGDNTRSSWRFWVNNNYAGKNTVHLRDATTNNTSAKYLYIGSNSLTLNNFLIGKLTPIGHTYKDTQIKNIVRGLPLDRTISNAISILENK